MSRPRILTDEQRKEHINISNKNWKDNHRDQVRYTQAKSKAKNFITKKARKDDLIYLKNLIDERLESME